MSREFFATRISLFVFSEQNQEFFFHSYNLFFFNFFNVYLFLRETDRAQAGEGQRERETQNPKQAPGSELSAQSPTRGSNPQTATS